MQTALTADEVRAEILSLLQEVQRPGIDRIIQYLCDSTFFKTGCHRHHCFEGGLARHSLEACRWALERSEGLPRESVILSTLLHDICTAHSPSSKHLHGHGRRSVAVIGSVCGLHLTPEEKEAILLHMHRDAMQMKTNPLAALVCQADKVSAAGKVHLEKEAAPLANG